MTSKSPQNGLAPIFSICSCEKANENPKADFMVLDILAASIVLKIKDSRVWVILLLSHHPIYPWKEPTQ